MSFPQTQRLQTHFASDAYKPSHDNLVDPKVTPFSPNAQHKSYILNTSVRSPLSSCEGINVLMVRRLSEKATSSMTTTMETSPRGQRILLPPNYRQQPGAHGYKG